MRQKFHELWTLAQQDRRKAATLGILMLVAVGMGVRTIVSGIGGPRAATAAAPRPSGGAAAPVAAPISVEDSLASLRAPTRTSPSGPPDRDLFKSGWALAAALEQSASAPGQSPGGGGGGGAGTGAGAPPKPVETRQSIIEREAAALRLRSTLLGANAVAVIERTGSEAGRPVIARVGDAIDGFRVTSIEAHAVTLEKEGVRVVLQQTRPTP